LRRAFLPDEEFPLKFKGNQKAGKNALKRRFDGFKTDSRPAGSGGGKLRIQKAGASG
jgi:hypothetical protein